MVSGCGWSEGHEGAARAAGANPSLCALVKRLRSAASAAAEKARPTCDTSLSMSARSLAPIAVASGCT